MESGKSIMPLFLRDIIHYKIVLNLIQYKGATSDKPVAPFLSSYSETVLDGLFQRLPLFFEPLEHSLATEMKTVIVVIGRVLLDLHLDIPNIYIFLLIGGIQSCAGLE